MFPVKVSYFWHVSYNWPPALCNSIPVTSHTLSFQDTVIKNTKDFGLPRYILSARLLLHLFFLLRRDSTPEGKPPLRPVAYMLPLRRGPSAGQDRPLLHRVAAHH